MGALLKQAVRADTGEQLGAVSILEADVATIVSAATHHRIVGPVRRLVGRHSEASPLKARLAALHVEQQAKVLVLESDLRFLLESVPDLPCVVLKGAAVAHRFYELPSDREYSDVDLLVPPEDVPVWRGALEAIGVRGAAESWDEAGRLGRSEVALRLPSGNVLDLHWGLINEMAIDAQFKVRANELIERRVRTDLGGLDAHVLTVEDALIHLCLHSCLDGADRLVWLRDIDQLVRSCAVDWSTVSLRARAMRLELVVAVMLARTASTCGTPIPSKLPLLHKRTLWATIAGIAYRVRPPYGVHDGRWTGRLVVLSTRSTSLRSVLELNRRILFDFIRPRLLASRRRR